MSSVLGADTTAGVALFGMAAGDTFLVVTLTATGRLAVLERRAGFDVAAFAAVFGALAFFPVAVRATIFFFVLPAVLAIDRLPAFARAAVFGRLAAAFGAVAFPAFAGLAAPLVSSSVNRSLSSFISFRRRESAVATSRIASLPSVMRA